MLQEINLRPQPIEIGSDEEIANRVITDMLANDALRIHSEGAFFSYTGLVSTSV
jgi:hypothetical protein